MKLLRLAWRNASSFVDALYAFLQRFLLPLLLIALGAIVAGNLGQSYGITYLFWDQVWYRQLIVGLTLGLGFAHIVFNGFLLDYGRWLDRKDRGDSTREHHWAERALLDENNVPRTFRGLNRASSLFLWYYYGFFALAVTLAFVFNKNYESLIRPGAELTVWPLMVGFFLTGCIGVRVLSTLGYRLTKRHVVRDENIMHFWAALVFVIFTIAYVVIYFFGRRLPASLPIIVVFSLVSGIYGFTSYAVSTWKVSGTLSLLGLKEISLTKHKVFISWIPPVAIMFTVLVVGLLFLGGTQRYKYRFPGLASVYNSPVGIEQSEVPELPLLNPSDITLTNIRQTRPFVIVTTSGGGITAAAWTMAVLNLLEDEATGLDDFPYAIRAIAGASGGMVGAAYWNATLQKPTAGDYHDVPNEALFTNITADSLTPVVHQLVFNDLWLSLFWPRSLENDRGQVLEHAWNRATEQSMARTLGDLYSGEKAGWRPSLIFAPMMVEDGRRLIISNLDLSQAITNVAPGTGDLTRTVSAVQFRELFPAQSLDWKLSTAARMNASFPYVSPAVSLPTTPKRRVVDAGYYDNYGINVAANWLMRCWDRKTLRAQTSHVIIIEINAFDRGYLSNPAVPNAEASGIGRALEGITGPPQGLLSAWGKRQSYRNDELITALDVYLHGTGEEAEIKLTTVRFPNGADVSLSWILTAQEKEYIRAAAAPEKLPELRKLQEAWK